MERVAAPVRQPLERLVPLADEAGNLRAYCLEVHDTCVSKLRAGREKDFAFIKELLDRGLVNMETFVARAVLVADMRDWLFVPVTI